MNSGEIQKLIDKEKPAFDYARMFLTAVAWWTFLIINFNAIKSSNSISLFLLFPVISIGGLFGLFLLIRINYLTEKIVDIILINTNILPFYIKLPLKILLFMVPAASAWLIVWSLMFSNVID